MTYEGIEYVIRAGLGRNEWARELWLAFRPDNRKNPNGRLGEGRSLSCCDVGDTVKTKFKVEPAGNSELGNHPEDLWYAWINGEWVLVPPDKIVPDYVPDGTPYLFMMVGTIQCFVRPRGGL